MEELKQFIIEKMDEYKEKHEELFFTEESMLEQSAEDMDDLMLYEGIIEGLAIALQKLKELEK